MKDPEMLRLTAKWRRLAAALLLAPLVSGFDGSRGREALDRAFHNLYGADVLAAVQLTVDGDGRPPRTLGYAYGRKRKGEEIRTLMFRSDGRATSDRALVLQSPHGADRMFVSQGSRGTVRPVAAGEAAWALFGSDFGYDDLRAHSSEEYRIEVLGTDVVQQEPTRVLRLRPFDGPYHMMLVWLSTRRPVILRVDYFDEQGLWKRYRADADRLRRHLEWWVPVADEMLDLRTGSRTRREVRNIVIDTAVPDELFTITQLERGRMPSF